MGWLDLAQGALVAGNMLAWPNLGRWRVCVCEAGHRSFATTGHHPLWTPTGDLPVRMDSPPYSLAVLPSSRPVARCDAEAAADLLRRCRRDPATAARAAGAWREEVLAAACAPAVRALAASYPPAALQDTLRRAPVEEPGVVLGRSTASRQPCDAPVHAAHAADAAPAPRRAPEWPPARPWRDRVAPRRAAGGAPDLAFDPGGISGGDPSISQPPAAHGFGAWDERCAGALAACLAVVAAEVARQAAAGCADLAALLADAWNANTALLGGAARRARDQAVRLAAANAALAAEAAAARDAGQAQRLALLELARERQVQGRRGAAGGVPWRGEVGFEDVRWASCTVCPI